MYPRVDPHPLLDRKKIYDRIQDTIFAYGENRNHHAGQTRVSVALQNGLLDPANLFYGTAMRFHLKGINPADQEGPAKAILRQMAFREISIIQARRKNLTLEDEPLTWAKALMHVDAYNNLIKAEPNPKSKITWLTMCDAKTHDADLNFLLNELRRDGIIPNRARMFFASRMFYEARTGVEALELLIKAFDLIGLDGQSPNNYTQCIGALGLSYGKVLKMNRDRAWELLGYK
jgi:deoxyribodipyrimidine photolyase